MCYNVYDCNAIYRKAYIYKAKLYILYVRKVCENTRGNYICDYYNYK